MTKVPTTEFLQTEIEEMQQMVSNKAVFIKDRLSGAIVSSIQEDGDGAVEVQALNNGKFLLIIHSRIDDTDRWEDLSATLEPKHFKLLGSIAFQKLIGEK